MRRQNAGLTANAFDAVRLQAKHAYHPPPIQRRNRDVCTCIARVNKQLKQHNTCLEQVSMVNFETGKVRQSLQITTAKIERKRGKPKVVLPTFCPFCGKRSAP